MPCKVENYDLPKPKIKINGLTIDDFEAVLCGVLSTDVVDLDDVDWKEAGVNRDLVERWWEKHKQKDQIRRDKETLAKLKEKVISNLSWKEKIALDILPSGIEIIHFAMSCGWVMTDKFLHLPGDESENWASHCITMGSIIVPHWLARRMFELNQITKIEADYFQQVLDEHEQNTTRKNHS